MSNGEFVVGELLGRVEAESDKGKTFATGLGHDLEAEHFKSLGEVVCGVSDVGHDGAVAMLSKADLVDISMF